MATHPITGTRNYVAVISGVNCAARASQFVKDKFRDVHKELLATNSLTCTATWKRTWTSTAA